MKTFQIPAVLLAVAMAGVLASPAPTSAAAGTKVVAFVGSYSGTASLLINGDSIKILSVKGKGSASVVGASSLSGIGMATASGTSACVPFKGHGTIKGSAGAITLSASPSTSQGCTTGQSGPVTVTVTGVAKVTGGSGSATGATGSLKFKGKLKLNDTTGSESGKFSGHISGKLTVNK